MAGVGGGAAGFGLSTAGLSFLITREGRTQALGMVLGAGRAVSLGGDSFWRQCESLMTRFLGAVAVSRSSSRGLCVTGAFFALSGRSGLASIDFFAACAGFQLGLSSIGFVLGVVGGCGADKAGGGGVVLGTSCDVDAGADLVVFSDAPALSALVVSGSTSCCQRLILSRTLAGLLMPMALPKSAPFMLLSAAGAPFFLPGVPFFLTPAGGSGSLGSGEAGIESRGHWSWRQALRWRVVSWGVVCVVDFGRWSSDSVSSATRYGS